MCEEDAPEDGDNNGSRDLPSEQVLQLEYENAKQRLDTQRESIRSFSKEGARYFRLLLILIGVPLAVLGALDPTTLSQFGGTIVSDKCIIESSYLCLPMRGATVLSFVLLLLTAIANVTAGGYEAHNIHNISNPEDIHETISSQRSVSEHLSIRLQDYRDRIEYNDELIFALDSILGFGKTTLVLSIFIISILAYRILAGTTVSLGLLIVLFMILGLVFKAVPYVLPDNFSNTDSILNFSPPYSRQYKEEIQNATNRDSKNSPEKEEEAN